MKRCLLLVLGLMAVACGSNRQVATPSPIATVASATPSTTQTAPPTVSRCDQYATDAQAKGQLRLATSPASPMGGTPATLTGNGLPPGNYDLRLSVVPESAAILQTVTVAADGRVAVTFTMPLLTVGTCVVPELRSVTRDEHWVAVPFLYPGTNLKPASCDALPDMARFGYSGTPFRFEAVPRSPVAREPVVVRGSLNGSPLSANPPVKGRASLLLGPPTPVAIAGSGQSDSQGNIEFVFIPDSHPDWRGLCVEIDVLIGGPPGDFGTLGYARINWP